MSIEETLRYIHSESWQKHKNGLDRIRTLLHSLGDPQKKLKFIHVAGTNGKGSTCAMLDSVLRQAGYRTGLYISPFLHRFNERMRLCGEEIPDETLEEITNLVRPAAEAMEEKPSEFELITAIAMVWFAREKTELVVLEVGLGGEFDSTNVIDPPEVSVICAIGLDHTAMLGNTIPEIAAAKAGILKTGSVAVTATGEAEADDVIRRVCREKGIPLTETELSKIQTIRMDETGSVFTYKGLEALRIPLVGAFQTRNAALAVETILALQKRGWRVSEEDIREGLAHTAWPGRFEILHREPLVILDGAHNPHGVRAAAESLHACYPERKFVFVIGAMGDKAVDEMLEVLRPLAASMVAVRPDSYRSLSAQALAGKISGHGIPVQAADTVEHGVRLAVKLAGKKYGVCALGSLYFSDAIRCAVQKL